MRYHGDHTYAVRIKATGVRARLIVNTAIRHVKRTCAARVLIQSVTRVGRLESSFSIARLQIAHSIARVFARSNCSLRDRSLGRSLRHSLGRLIAQLSVDRSLGRSVARPLGRRAVPSACVLDRSVGRSAALSLVRPLAMTCHLRDSM